MTGAKAAFDTRPKTRGTELFAIGCAGSTVCRPKQTVDGALGRVADVTLPAVLAWTVCGAKSDRRLLADVANFAHLSVLECVRDSRRRGRVQTRSGGRPPKRLKVGAAEGAFHRLFNVALAAIAPSRVASRRPNAIRVGRGPRRVAGVAVLSARGGDFVGDYGWCAVVGPRLLADAEQLRSRRVCVGIVETQVRLASPAGGREQNG